MIRRIGAKLSLNAVSKYVAELRKLNESRMIGSLLRFGSTCAESPRTISITSQLEVCVCTPCHPSRVSLLHRSSNPGTSVGVKTRHPHKSSDVRLSLKSRHSLE